MATKIKTYDENLRLTGVTDMPETPTASPVKWYNISHGKTGYEIDASLANQIANEIRGGTLVLVNTISLVKKTYNNVLSLTTNELGHPDTLYFVDEQGAIILYEW